MYLVASEAHKGSKYIRFLSILTELEKDQSELSIGIAITWDTIPQV
jgi:hypothetical protein